MAFWNRKQESESNDEAFTKDSMGESRSYVAKNAKDGVDPRSAIADYGDYDEDHNEAEHEKAHHKGKQCPETGIRTPTAEQTADFLDDNRPEDIKIRKRR